MQPRTVLAISTFRSDAATLALIEQASHLVPRVFERVIVVDSLGSGRIAEECAGRGWSFVHYENAERNLGSAGNLARRLALGAELGADYVYALNHDGALGADAVVALVREASQDPLIGAAFPLRRLPNRQGKFDVTGRVRFPVPRIAVKDAPSASFPVYWGSSNGALYSTKPIREGLLPWSELWMGWEDMGYGWLLQSRGYKQLVVSDAHIDDPYEFAPTLGGKVYRSDKPAWYAYYTARNLLLCARLAEQPPGVWAAVAARIGIECVVTGLLRENRAKRFKLMYRGILDGVAGRSGLVVQPGSV